MLPKKVKLPLAQLQVCIFAGIVFGVRCTLMTSAFALTYLIPPTNEYDYQVENIYQKILYKKNLELS